MNIASVRGTMWHTQWNMIITFYICIGFECLGGDENEISWHVKLSLGEGERGDNDWWCISRDHMRLTHTFVSHSNVLYQLFKYCALLRYLLLGRVLSSSGPAVLKVESKPCLLRRDRFTSCSPIRPWPSSTSCRKRPEPPRPLAWLYAPSAMPCRARMS